MDSVTQASLGAAVGYAVIGREIGPKAMIWGAVVATLPDLDVFVPLGSDVANFTEHRAASHSLFVQTAASPAVAWIIGRVQSGSYPLRFRRWLLALLCLVTHALLDGLTVYGTQLFWPLPVAPITWSTVFIIDPAYTLPLIVGLIGARAAGQPGRCWNHWGLAVSSAYLVFTIGVKIHVDRFAASSLGEEAGARFISMATPFNAVLWRFISVDGEEYREGYYSLFDVGGRVAFTSYPSNHALLNEIATEEAVRRLRWFTKGFYAVKRMGSEIHLIDLRMGFEPSYVFGFQVGEVENGRVVPVRDRRIDSGPDVLTMGWVWRRIWDQTLPSPHQYTAIDRVHLQTKTTSPTFPVLPTKSAPPSAPYWRVAVAINEGRGGGAILQDHDALGHLFDVVCPGFLYQATDEIQHPTAVAAGNGMGRMFGVAQLAGGVDKRTAPEFRVTAPRGQQTEQVQQAILGRPSTILDFISYVLPRG